MLVYAQNIVGSYIVNECFNVGINTNIIIIPFDCFGFWNVSDDSEVTAKLVFSIIKNTSFKQKE